MPPFTPCPSFIIICLQQLVELILPLTSYNTQEMALTLAWAAQKNCLVVRGEDDSSQCYEQRKTISITH